MSTQPAGEGMADADLRGIESDGSRHYIPLPGGWEIQTNGSGSTFRIAKANSDDRIAIPDSPYLHETMERMARETHATRAALIAERDALRQSVESRKDWVCRETYDLTLQAVEAQLRATTEVIANNNRLAARCEGLEKLLRNCRDNYVEPELRLERLRFKGYENCSNIPALESDLAAIDAALSPPASDATEPLAAGVA